MLESDKYQGKKHNVSDIIPQLCKLLPLGETELMVYKNLVYYFLHLPGNWQLSQNRKLKNINAV